MQYVFTLYVCKLASSPRTSTYILKGGVDVDETRMDGADIYVLYIEFVFRL